jgi:hypothetical protein
LKGDYGLEAETREMNWEAVAAVAEVLGLIAVIASLMYIGVQSKQSNDHAIASSEIDWMHAWNELLNNWIADENTIKILQKGFGSFNNLSNSEKAVFHMRIAAMVNHWLLAKKLDARNLISKDIAVEATKVVLATLTTQGGYEYIEHDWKLFPGGAQLMEQVRACKGKTPNLTEVLPWWSEDGEV